MDIEYRLTLLGWAAGAPLPQLRQAVQAGAQQQATRLLTRAITQSVALAVPRLEAEDTAAPPAVHPAVDSSASSDVALLIPAAARSHIAKFVEDTVDSLAQLTSYLLTEQVRPASWNNNARRQQRAGKLPRC